MGITTQILAVLFGPCRKPLQIFNIAEAIRTKLHERAARKAAAGAATGAPDTYGAYIAMNPGVAHGAMPPAGC